MDYKTLYGAPVSIVTDEFDSETEKLIELTQE
jgi:hypothetical protein